MNRSYKSGIVHIWDLPDNLILVGLKEDFKNNILKTIKFNFKTIRKFTKLINKDIYFYFNLKTNQKVRLDYILAIINILNKFNPEINLKDLEKNINLVGTKRGNIYIKNPRLPFNLKNEYGAYFISSIMFDGGIDREYKPHYGNLDLSMRKRIVNCVERIFGEIKSKEVNYKRSYFIRFPKTIGIILNHCFKIGVGNKMYCNNKVPNFIFGLNEEQKACFIRQAFDDDGSVSVDKKTIRIVGVSDIKRDDFGKQETIVDFNLLNDLKKLLLSIGVESNPIRLSGKKYSNKEYNQIGEFYRHIFTFSISDRKNLELFRHKIGFNLKYKQIRLKNILEDYKEFQLRKGEIHKIALEKAKLLQKEFGYFNNILLSNKINRLYRQTVRITKKMLKDNKIIILEEAIPTGKGWIPEKYVINNAYQ